MKKEIIYVFKIQNKIVETVNWDIETSDVDIIKGCLAFTKGVDVEDIDFEKVDIYEPDLSEKFFVRHDGCLMSRNTTNCSSHVTGFRPAMDISHEELFYEFLDLIHKKDIDNAITFY